MTVFTPRVLRLLATELTSTPLRQIDALFDDHGVQLGPPQPSDTDESQRRERMRRYLVTTYVPWVRPTRTRVGPTGTDTPREPPW